jgi:acyl-CoA thioester hydrolase/1,4-dihydroxy-2-naphthoyl-CoA hydrolase
MTFRSSIYVPFHLADPGGVLFFGHAFSLAHEAYEQLVQSEWGFIWGDWFQNPDWVVPIKKAEANYLAPIQAGQACLIEVEVAAVSTSSFTLKSVLSQQTPCCEVFTVHVFCDRATKKKQPIPQGVAKQIQLNTTPTLS